MPGTGGRCGWPIASDSVRLTRKSLGCKSKMLDLATLIDSFLLPISYLAVLPYFSFLLITSLLAILRGRRSGKDDDTGGPVRMPQRRFLIAIPAHDEQVGVAKTVRSCLAIDYPGTLFEVLVIADNCTDQTAARARRREHGSSTGGMRPGGARDSPSNSCSDGSGKRGSLMGWTRS